MRDIKAELEQEKKQLDEKIGRLKAFAISKYYDKVDAIQQSLLNIQLPAMETYSQCLLERILTL